jgi:uncharacterized Zn finger protein
MKLLRCKLCRGELDIVGGERSINKKVRCRQCGYTNANEPDKKGPEVVIIRKRHAITFAAERTKPLNEITAADVPRGLDPNDVAFNNKD